MKQITKFPKGVGRAKGDPLFSGYDLTHKVYGDACEDRNSGLTAFAYLFRRFGPPWVGSDGHKDIACWNLTTNDPEVWMWVSPSGSSLRYCIGYMRTEALWEAWQKPRLEWNTRYEKWWLKNIHPEFTPKALKDKKTKERALALFWDPADYEKNREKARKEIGACQDGDPTITERVTRAMTEAMRELLKPVFVRDVPINVFGVYKDDEVPEGQGEPSVYSGYGLFSAKRHIEKMILDEAKQCRDPRKIVFP